MYILVVVYLSLGVVGTGLMSKPTPIGTGVAVGHIQFSTKSECESAAENLKTKLRRSHLDILTECQYVR